MPSTFKIDKPDYKFKAIVIGESSTKINHSILWYLMMTYVMI